MNAVLVVDVLDFMALDMNYATPDLTSLDSSSMLLRQLMITFNLSVEFHVW